MKDIHITQDENIHLECIDTGEKLSLREVIEKEITQIYVARMNIHEFIQLHGEMPVRAALRKVMDKKQDRKSTLSHYSELYAVELEHTKQAYSLVKKALITNIQLLYQDSYCLHEKRLGWWHLSKLGHQSAEPEVFFMDSLSPRRHWPEVKRKTPALGESNGLYSGFADELEKIMSLSGKSFTSMKLIKLNGQRDEEA